MQFIEHTNSFEIVFDKEDTPAEKGMIQHGLALLRLLLFQFHAAANKSEVKSG